MSSAALGGDGGGHIREYFDAQQPALCYSGCSTLHSTWLTGTEVHGENTTQSIIMCLEHEGGL